MKQQPKKVNNSPDFSDIPLSSSLAHLAYGDIAFKAWREKKKELRKKTVNNEK